MCLICSRNRQDTYQIGFRHISGKTILLVCNYLEFARWLMRCLQTRLSTNTMPHYVYDNLKTWFDAWVRVHRVVNVSFVGNSPGGAPVASTAGMHGASMAGTPAAPSAGQFIVPPSGAPMVAVAMAPPAMDAASAPPTLQMSAPPAPTDSDDAKQTLLGSDPYKGQYL